MDASSNAPVVGSGGTRESASQLQIEHLKADNQRLLLINQKLSLEIESLTRPVNWLSKVKQFLPLITVALAVAGFWGGIFQYRNSVEAQRVADREQRKHEDEQLQAAAAEQLRQQQAAERQAQEAMRRDAVRPLSEKQLGLYLEASKLAAVIATTKKDDERRDAETQFWVLYLGPLAAVEDVNINSQGDPVEAAMVVFGNALHESPMNRDSKKMENLALALSQTIKEKALRPLFDTKEKHGSDTDVRSP